MTESAFNKIFEDRKKAAHLSARADLMIVVQQLIKESGMNNSQVARQLGVSRSSVSELMNGKIDRISLDSAIQNGYHERLADRRLPANHSPADNQAED